MYDAIVVFAGGIDQQGILSSDSIARTRHGVSLFHKGYASEIIFSGKYSFAFTQIPPRTEAEAMREIACDMGISEDHIHLDTISNDSIGTPFFTRKNILEKNKWRDVAVVTSDYHVGRVSYLYDALNRTGYMHKVFGCESNLTKDQRVRIETNETLFHILTQRWCDSILRSDDEAVQTFLDTEHPGYASNPPQSIQEIQKLYLGSLADKIQ